MSARDVPADGAAASAPTCAPGSTVTPLITAAEAFPILERQVAAALETVDLSFRIFDTRTHLRDPDALAAADGGDDWASLLAALAARGVRIRLLVADFDAIGGADLHRAAWASLRHLDAVTGEVPGAAGRIEALAALHPATVGPVWRKVFRPRARRELASLRARFGDSIGEELPGLQPVLAGAPPELHPATFHQKAAVVDGRFALVGGLDVDERRWDTTDHDRPAEETWRDVTLAVEGEPARQVAAAVRRVWDRAVDDLALRRTPPPPLPNLVSPEKAPAPEAPAMNGSETFDTRLTLSSPRPGAFSFGPETTEEGNLQAALDIIGAARRFLYLETQFLRSARIARALAEAADARPELELVTILPFAPEHYAFEKKRDSAVRHGEALQVAAVRRVRLAYRDRCAVLSPAKPTRRSPEDSFAAFGAGIVYVHSKVLIADAEVALVGSANMNGRSLSWDTEISALWRDPAGVAGFLDRLAASWLGAEATGPFDRLAPWREAADRNAARPPDLREGFLLPHVVRRARRFGRRLPFIPDEMF